MYNYKLTIQYEGTKYKGWQRLNTTDKTIQGKIEAVLSQLLDTEILIIGSGRTDAGVHAYGQIANFFSKKPLHPDIIKDYLYQYLPKDIMVTEVVSVDERFHARYNVKDKCYIYKVNNNPHHHVFDRKMVLHVPEQLDLGLMRKAATKFMGTHDFKSFSTMRSKKKSTIKTLDDVRIEEKDGYLSFIFIGEGFLYNMIRIIVGTLLEVGRGNLTPADIETIFEKKQRQSAGPTIPPHGLYLMHVHYK